MELSVVSTNGTFVGSAVGAGVTDVETVVVAVVSSGTSPT